MGYHKSLFGFLKLCPTRDAELVTPEEIYTDGDAPVRAVSLEEHDIIKKADYSYTNPRFIEKVYSVGKTDLPESYYETLQHAVREHIDVAPVINDMLDTAIEDVEAEL